MKKILYFLLILFLFTNQTFAIKIEKDSNIYNEYKINYDEFNNFFNVKLFPDLSNYNFTIKDFFTMVRYLGESLHGEEYDMDYLENISSKSLLHVFLNTFLEEYTDFEKEIIDKIGKRNYLDLISKNKILKLSSDFENYSRGFIFSRKYLVNSEVDQTVTINFSPYDKSFIGSFDLEENSPNLLLYSSKFEPRYFINGKILERYYVLVKNKLSNGKIIYRAIPYYRGEIKLKTGENSFFIQGMSNIGILQFEGNFENPGIIF